MRKLVLVASLFVLSALPLCAQDRGPSTAEERAKAVQLTRALEADPLNGKARDARAWLTVWIISVPDISVKLCGQFMSSVLGAKKNYSSEIIVQNMFSTAAFVIEHPDQKDNEEAKYLAGVEGALRAYESIRKTKPKVKWPILDELIAKRDAGELAAYVREKMPACK
jgi:carboxypeptidase Q